MQTWDITSCSAKKTMHQTLKERLRKRIESSPQEVFLRKDFEHLGNYRQLSRALDALQSEAVVVRAGYGVYLRPKLVSVETAVRKVRERLGHRVNRQLTVAGTTVVLGAKAVERTNDQDRLDRRKLVMARTILKLCSIDEIRRKSLENIRRWNESGVWVSAHDEWRKILEHGSDREVIEAMTGEDERANRLRQSAPYSGLLNTATLERLH
jgi:hypothetical protein